MRSTLGSYDRKNLQAFQRSTPFSSLTLFYWVSCCRNMTAIIDGRQAQSNYLPCVFVAAYLCLRTGLLIKTPATNMLITFIATDVDLFTCGHAFALGIDTDIHGGLLATGADVLELFYGVS